MPQRKPSLIGQTFGKLKVIGDAPPRGYHQYSICICKCGRQTVSLSSHLRNGRILGCISCRSRTHGKRHTKAYRAWAHARDRCFNEKCHNYADYGGRGITVCDKWSTFEGFHEDMGDCPEGLSLHRIDNDKGYYKENCKWATRLEQGQNRRGNRYYTVRGVTACLSELCRHFGLEFFTIRKRLDRGWELERAFFEPTYRGGHPAKGQPPTSI